MTTDAPLRAIRAAKHEDPELDSQRMQRFYAGDEQAFTDLASDWHRSLIGFFFGMGFRAEDAEDLTQETLVRLYLTRDRARFDPNRRFTPYILTTARNLALDERRHRSRRPSQVALTEELRMGGEPIVNEAFLGELLECVQSLPELQQSYLLLCGRHGLGEFSHQEIAATLRKLPSQISELSQRTFRSLRQCLEKKGYRFDADSG